MRRLCWLALGLLACGCGGRVVGMIGPDAADTAPPQRGPTDGGGFVIDAAPPPTPVDAFVADVPSAPDVPIDRPIIVIVDAGPPDVVVGVPCTVANDTATCPNGFYCQSTNCMTGTCVAAPVTTDEVPVCGCDRLTYWNSALAATNGAAVRVAGACPAGIVCAGANNVDCPTGALCNLEQANAAACNANNPAGRCWVLPDTCPPLAAGMMPTTRRCNTNNMCQSVCTLITAGRSYFVDATCP